ncbi:MAG TPA: hypothetical protein VN213_09540 [Solirubrobacteraceae bacterium]|nr:hypothetical protein [Solirubrobacteraceae bacterium]
MTDEDLRDRLGRLDPARRLDVAAFIESRTAHDIRERAMQTTSEPTVENRPRPVLAVVASVVTLAVVVGGAALAAGDGIGREAALAHVAGAWRAAAAVNAWLDEHVGPTTLSPDPRGRRR